MKARHLTNKRRRHDGLAALAEARLGGVGRALADLYHPSVEWRGSHPLNEVRGIEKIEARVWASLIRSFPDLERRDVIFVGGSYEGRNYVAMVGLTAGRSARAG